MAKKKASKSASGSSKKPSLSPYPDDLDAHGEPDGDATMSSFPGSRATSPAASIVSTSGSEDNPDIKDFYADAGDINVVPLICKWAGCGEVQSDLQCLLDHVHEAHIGTNKSKYSCDWEGCPRRGKPQTSRFALLSHLRSHTGEKPFTCPRPECDKSFTRSDAMAKHMRVQHGTAPPPARPGQIKKPAAGAGNAAGGEGSDGEEAAGNEGPGGDTAAPTLSSIWECEADSKTEYAIGSTDRPRTSRSALADGLSTRSSQRDRSASTDLPSSSLGGHQESAPTSYPAGNGWVYEEIPAHTNALQTKVANQEVLDEADLSFWSTKGSEVELLRSQVLNNQGATGAGGLPVDSAAQMDKSTVEQKERIERNKRNTLNGTEEGMETAIKLGFVAPLAPRDSETGGDSDSEIDEESKESWMRDDRQNAFEIGLLSDSRKKWVESERIIRSKIRQEMELLKVLEEPSMKEAPSNETSTTPAPSTSAMTPPPPPDQGSSSSVSKQPLKKRRIGGAEAASLGLFTNVPVDQGAAAAVAEVANRTAEEEELDLMRKRYLIEKAKLNVVANERRRMEIELKELKKLRNELRDGPEGTKDALKGCLTIELGPNVNAIFSPPNSP